MKTTIKRQRRVQIKSCNDFIHYLILNIILNNATIFWNAVIYKAQVIPQTAKTASLSLRITGFWNAPEARSANWYDS
jgi:hypothetical protein